MSTDPERGSVIPPPGSLEACSRRARLTTLWFILGGGALAFLVSPMPGAASAVLIFLEAWMLYLIARIYGLAVPSGWVIAAMGVLLALSLVLKLLVMEILTTFAPLWGWLIKPLIAMLVIWLLSESTIQLYRKWQQDDLT